MFRWSVSKSAVCKASRESIWKLWADVANWPQWDASLEWSKLEGEFIVGAQGTLKPKDWSISSFTITEVTKNSSFSTVARMPFTTMTFEHVITDLDSSRILITHTAIIKGLLAPILYFALRKKLIAGLQEAVTSLAIIAEKRSGNA